MRDTMTRPGRLSAGWMWPRVRMAKVLTSCRVNATRAPPSLTCGTGSAVTLSFNPAPGVALGDAVQTYQIVDLSGSLRARQAERGDAGREPSARASAVARFIRSTAATCSAFKAIQLSSIQRNLTPPATLFANRVKVAPAANSTSSSSGSHPKRGSSVRAERLFWLLRVTTGTGSSTQKMQPGNASIS